MEFIKAQELKKVSDIMNAIQKDVINSAMFGCTETQTKHYLYLDSKLVNEIEKYLIDAGYKVYLKQGFDSYGAKYTTLTVKWDE